MGRPFTASCTASRTASLTASLTGALALAAALPVLAEPARAQTADAAAEAAAPFGPQAGETAPAFSLTDSQGETRTLADLAGENGLVVYFNRSLDWCPICQAQTLEVDEAASGFAERGYAVAVITYDAPEVLARFDARRQVSLTLLSDEGSAVIDAFDIRDPVYDDPDSRAYGVPYPIAFVLGPDGQVKAKLWHEAGLGEQRGYATRITPEDMFDTLDAL